MERQRGYTMLELVVIVALLGLSLVATAASMGARVPRAHPAELALQAALVDARALAASTGNVTNSAVATGATVTVDRDPRDRSGYGSIIRVFRSRPIPYTGGPGFGPAATAPNRLLQDTGFATAYVGATFHLSDTSATGGLTDRPFTILISTSGYASVLRGYLYDPAANNYFRSPDPGCRDGAVSIVADDGVRRDGAPFSCREGVLQLPAAPNAS
ncbi:MAG: hypothetical protein NVSMB21_15880 [Vulcanimicrobiaceae bacterium]